ncbi:MAG TPA: hypothetical protein VFO86_07975, partial [Terriglobia bacterium]|nr:hypothetical protein [Terriglobia bacterium]
VAGGWLASCRGIRRDRNAQADDEEPDHFTTTATVRANPSSQFTISRSICNDEASNCRYPLAQKDAEASGGIRSTAPVLTLGLTLSYANSSHHPA